MTFSLLADPCLARYGPNLRCYLSKDSPSIGFGYSLTQSYHDKVLLAAMNHEIVGGICEFLKRDSTETSETLQCPVNQPFWMGHYASSAQLCFCPLMSDHL